MFDEDFFDEDDTDNAYFSTTSERQSKLFAEKLFAYLNERKQSELKTKVTETFVNIVN